jgi:hypothetical protein
VTSKRAVFQFTEPDFASLDGHSQRWRFDAEVRPHVRLLTAATGRAVDAALDRYVGPHDYTLSTDHVRDIEEHDASGDDAVVASWLRAHEMDLTLEVVVSHGPALPVYLVTWGLFCTHWSDFCLPSSDDVLICPVSATWILLYHHEEVFYWATPAQDVGSGR